MLSGITKTLKYPVSPLNWLATHVSVMDRYLFTELTMPFLFGVGVFTSFSLSIGTLFDLVRKVTDSELPLAIAVKVFILQVPHFIALALPMSVLLASLMTYSRLSSDSELIALRSCGVSIYRLIVPTLIFSLGVTGLSFALNELVVPEANYEATTTLERVLKGERPDFRSENILFKEYREIEQPDGGEQEMLSRLFYAKRFDGDRMQGMTVLDFSQQGLNQVLAAESARWNPRDNTWDFRNGTIYLVNPDGSYRNIVRFQHQQVRLPRAPLDLAQRTRDYGEMNIAQAQEYLEILSQGSDEDKIRKLKIRIQQKYAIPFICVVMGIVGTALGTRPQRTGRATSFGISILVIFAYYLLAFVLDSLGQLAVLTPFLAAWLPNLIVLGMGLLLLVRASR